MTLPENPGGVSFLRLGTPHSCLTSGIPDLPFLQIFVLPGSVTNNYLLVLIRDQTLSSKKFVSPWVSEDKTFIQDQTSVVKPMLHTLLWKSRTVTFNLFHKQMGKLENPSLLQRHVGEYIRVYLCSTIRYTPQREWVINIHNSNNSEFYADREASLKGLPTTRFYLTLKDMMIDNST